MLTLDPLPTFDWPVELTIPGQEEPVKIVITWAYKDRDEHQAWINQALGTKGKKDVDLLAEVIKGWSEKDIDVPYTKANLAKLLKRYHGSALQLVKAYAAGLHGGRLKN